MGMDVFGKAPLNNDGKYFRNNVWWWHPLATFLTATYSDLTTGCTHWHTNDGDGLNAKDSAALADAIDRDLTNGKVAAYRDEYNAELSKLPDSECTWCEGTGLRTDEVGRLHGFDKPRDPKTGKGGCNACAGTGRLEHFATHYAFDVENVREFATFLRYCGGFEIC